MRPAAAVPDLEDEHAAMETDLPDGMLPPARADLALLVAVVGICAAAEAAWNVGQATLHLLHLPLPLAIAFPAVLEAAAFSCALQDLRDRRRGVRSTAMAAGTYLGLLTSAAVNGAVGWATSGAPGLLEVLPPLVLAALIHLHGDRATRAWHSRARTRASWRAEQLDAARIESVSEVLPLLAGTDSDGTATVALLRRRLHSLTLTPTEALVAAGWHQRQDRDLTDPQLRRLEIVAATVWGSQPPAHPSVTAVVLSREDHARTTKDHRGPGKDHVRTTQDHPAPRTIHPEQQTPAAWSSVVPVVPVVPDMERITRRRPIPVDDEGRLRTTVEQLLASGRSITKRSLQEAGGFGSNTAQANLFRAQQIAREISDESNPNQTRTESEEN
jgi:hypothetical protein